GSLTSPSLHQFSTPSTSNSTRGFITLLPLHGAQTRLDPEQPGPTRAVNPARVPPPETLPHTCTIIRSQPNRDHPRSKCFVTISRARGHHTASITHTRRAASQRRARAG